MVSTFQFQLEVNNWSKFIPFYCTKYSPLPIVSKVWADKVEMTDYNYYGRENNNNTFDEDHEAEPSQS